jgi:hypothetical protein
MSIEVIAYAEAGSGESIQFWTFGRDMELAEFVQKRAVASRDTENAKAAEISLLGYGCELFLDDVRAMDMAGKLAHDFCMIAANAIRDGFKITLVVS